MRLVLDTNVVISAFINPNGTPSQIIKLILRRKADFVYNSVIVSEYEKAALRPKFSMVISSEKIRRFLDIMKSIGYSYDPVPGKMKMIDESDRIFYDTAKESNSILITGNKKHYPKVSFIMQPAEFLKNI